MSDLSQLDANAIFQLFASGKIISCAQIGGLSSSNYHLHAEDGKQYVLKRATPRYVQDFEAILASYRAIRGQGVPAVVPLAGHDRRFLQAFLQDTFALFPFISGKTLHQDTLTPRGLEAAGLVLGRIHTTRIDGWRRTSSHLSHQEGMRQSLMRADLRTVRAGSLIEESLRAKAALRELLESRLSATADRVLLHGDFHNGNLLYGSDEAVVGVVDLELSMVGDAGRDYLRFIDLACCNTAFEEVNLRMAKIFLGAYRQMRPLDRTAFESSVLSYLYSASQSTFFESAIALEHREELTPYLQRDLEKIRFYMKNLADFMGAIW